MTIDQTLSDMVLFSAVVQESGFTNAARKLGIAKQSVSARIARLESKLGVRLLERTTRRMRPTEAGVAYYERCRRIALEVEEANQEVRSRQVEPAGVLRVAAPYLFGRRFLAPVIVQYMRACPKVRVELVLADRRANLVEEGFDVAVRVGALDDSSLTAVRLGSAPVSVVASPAFLKRNPLAKTDDVVNVDSVGIRSVESWVLDGTRYRVRPKLVVNDLEMAGDAVAASLGIGFLPELVTRARIESGKLRRVCDGTSRSAPVFALYPSRSLLPAKVRTFLEHLGASRGMISAG